MKPKRCERDFDFDTQAFAQGGCAEAATEVVVNIEDTPAHLCPAHAAEGKRLNGMLRRIMDGDAEAQRLNNWINDSPTREEYDRRVAALPLDGGG